VHGVIAARLWRRYPARWLMITPQQSFAQQEFRTVGEREAMGMWPALFGPGWEWGILGSLGLMAGIITLLVKMFAAAKGKPEATEDGRAAIWRRYEIGDLTRPEFERLRAGSASSWRPHGRSRADGRADREGSLAEKWGPLE